MEGGKFGGVVEGPVQGCVGLFWGKEVGDVLMCLYDSIELGSREVGCATWAVLFQVGVGEYSV